jgi:hypothetical protein
MVSWAPVTNAVQATKAVRPAAILLTRNFPLTFDLDGDLWTDHVSLISNGFNKTIRIKFGNSRDSDLTFTANSVELGTLVASDIDHDGDIDLIWLSGPEQTDAIVWINGGKGDFSEAQDNTPYLAELKALVSDGGSPDQHSLGKGQPGSSVTSSSFHDVPPASASRLMGPSVQEVIFLGFNGFANRSAFLSYLHKRGPPVVLS